MKHYLSNEIFLKIYSFVGNNALYFDKTYYLFLLEMRQKFIENPIIIKYNIVKWKYPTRDKIINLKENNLRPRLKVERNNRIMKLSSRVYIEKILDSDKILITDNSLEIIPSINLKKKIIDSRILFSCIGQYVNTKVRYLDIFIMLPDNTSIYEYKNLWVI